MRSSLRSTPSARRRRVLGLPPCYAGCDPPVKKKGIEAPDAVARCGRRSAAASTGGLFGARDAIGSRFSLRPGPRRAAGMQEGLDLVDALAGVAMSDVDQRPGVGGVEEQIAHQVGALCIRGAEAVHQV